MNIVFLGCTRFSHELLDFLIKNNFIPKLVITITEEFKISYSEKKVKIYNYADIKGLCDKHRIPVLEVDSGSNKKLTTYRQEIESAEPDVILVLGWYYMIPAKIRTLARYGAWGIHASLLPKYAGGAPLVWAMINGEKKTGVTLFRLSDGIDNGDIISQKSFKIEFEDTINEVYQKAIKASKVILLQALKNPEKIRYRPQDKKAIEVWPQRKPEDGKIDLNMKGIDMYNFIRAQAPPYPGAFIETKDGYKIIIEKCRIEKIEKNEP